MLKKLFNNLKNQNKKINILMIQSNLYKKKKKSQKISLNINHKIIKTRKIL